MMRRYRERQRASSLIGPAPRAVPAPQRGPELEAADIFFFAGISRSWGLLSALSILSGALLSSVLHLFLSLWLLPVSFLAGAAFPISFLRQRAARRALEFAEHFPAVLQATASGLSAGSTALVAIERSVTLLPRDNLVRKEVEELIQSLQSGLSQAEAISRFGSSVRLAELSLFRTAFLLSLEQGGRLSPTLERLARVLRERLTLISTAHSVTAVMKMTAHILLVITPIVLALLAVRTENFFELLLHHPVANPVASFGFALISINFFILRRMSNFQP